ncbi:cytochrome P450 [Sulfitobacter sp. M57]|uniref:cytochrome P450 n=1 Tax=unclassified Sulfitobacter TaxID=196795 RepID=UPI0023E097E8|nr:MULTISPECIES: cytochrome P450 [unclassified Sulfitobacter]MDF3416108.1 cytochrome P450 [Sulfitobacter sp. KE5]MDF3423587.1 cytochrome P450 [Sulfitobacter sp. KE43]MDF3434611.1 cytochrome P450 [Sulfitobacter sp. KE42]MDF3460293.1 cytochrome P450 [Sulfitobacter sp. S74]MDF3464149.1 cytochrome P450 [Sulfitobacter sp. Ks18]
MTVEKHLSTEGYDIFDLNAPHAKWLELREEAPVFQDPQTGYWIVTRHADVKAVFEDWNTFSSDNAQAPMRPMCDAGKQIMKDGGFTVYSGLSARVPPDHTRIRKIAQSAFGPRRFKAIQPRIEAIIDRHLNKIAIAGSCDFFREVAYDVPALVLFALMGIPDDDVPKVKDWAASRALLTWGNLSDEEQLPLAQKMVEYWSYCRNLVAARKETPGDDFPTDMVQAQANGADITDEEIAGVMYSVLFAGHETTTTLMSNAVITLMSNRHAWEAICADPSLIPKATEEVLRFEPSIVSWRRRAKTKAAIGGVPVPEGANILLVMGSGNRDKAVFENAETFDIHRDNARNHLSFGYGIHFCIGFQLAKLEFGIMLRELASRFPNMTMKPDQHIEYLHNISFRVPNKVMLDLGLEAA